MWRARYLLACTLTCQAAAPAAPAPAPAMDRQLNVMVGMRDGVRLSTHVFKPAGRGPFPTILIRTPYNKGADLFPSYYPFIDHGYAVVVQDVRGRYLSEGVFHPLDQEGPDGYDALNWIGKQAWSTGRVGMVGGSYVGISQWKVAVLNNPHLKAIFPVVSGSDDYLDRFYSEGGALKLAHRLLWMSDNVKLRGFEPDFAKFILHLPLRTADVAATGQRVDFYQKALDHPADDAFWKSISVREQLSKVAIPVFAVGGWYDNFAQSDLETFAAMSKAGHPHRILVGPWPHNMSTPFPEMDFGKDAKANIRRYEIDWFDRWVKGTGAAPEPAAMPVRIFVMGRNEWRDEAEWPLRRALPTKFFLNSKGHANTLGGDGELRQDAKRRSKPDEYVYDPRKPVPTRGGPVCCNPKVIPWGPMDQRAVEQRNDVLVYTSEALKSDLEVTGPIHVFLHVSTDARDTDFTAKLVDVYPEGRAINLTDGILRLRYRISLEKTALATPRETYPIMIDAGVTSNVFKAGHRIRIEISSSNFPRFDRNPNTGRAIADETELRTANQVIYHDSKHPSYALLPVIPAEGKPLGGALPGQVKTFERQ